MAAQVFRKGSTWAKLGVATGEGYPTLAVNREHMWMASSSWGRPGLIALHDLGAARAVGQFNLGPSAFLAFQSVVTHSSDSHPRIPPGHAFRRERRERARYGLQAQPLDHRYLTL